MIIQKVPRKKASTIVVEQIENMIASGLFKSGDKLPSVREMCEMFDVGRSTVRDAIITLKGKGTVYVKQGEGTFVKDFDSAPIFQKSVLRPNQKNIQELFQVRRIIEAGVVKEAARCRTEDDLIRLKNILTSEKEEWELDYNFHMAIAQVTKNKIITQFMEFISATLQQSMIEFHKRIKHDVNVVQMINDQHELIYEMIKLRHPSKAYEAMVTHLIFVEKMLVTYFSDEPTM